MPRKVPIGVLVSGNGTNLQAIIDAIEANKLSATIQLVVSNRADAYGLARAKNHGIPTEVLDHKQFPDREAFDQRVVDLLKARGVELVVLAGFMRLLSPAFVKAYSNRIMNIHPALLPSFRPSVRNYSALKNSHEKLHLPANPSSAHSATATAAISSAGSCPLPDGTTSRTRRRSSVSGLFGVGCNLLRK